MLDLVLCFQKGLDLLQKILVKEADIQSPTEKFPTVGLRKQNILNNKENYVLHWMLGLTLSFIRPLLQSASENRNTKALIAKENRSPLFLCEI